MKVLFLLLLHQLAEIARLQRKTLALSFFFFLFILLLLLSAAISKRSNMRGGGISAVLLPLVIV